MKKEWESVKILIDTFPSKFTSKRSHTINYYKNKLNNSPYGESIITRVINKNDECLGILTLTKKFYFGLNRKYVSYELGDVYIIHNLQGKIYLKILLKKVLNF